MPLDLGGVGVAGREEVGSELGRLSWGPSPACLIQMERRRPTLPTPSLVCIVVVCTVWGSHGAAFCSSKDFPEAVTAALGHPHPSGEGRAL